MPVYRWDAIAADDFRWLRDRARRGADLYDGCASIISSGSTAPSAGRAMAASRSSRRRRKPIRSRSASAILEIFREPGAEIIAEDLGTVPDYVRESLARIGMPGFRVFRWERRWHCEGQPFRDPAGYPAASVAATGTHDTEPMAMWWDRADADERRKVADIPSVQRLDAGIADRAFDPDRARHAARGALRLGIRLCSSRRFRTSSAGATASTSRQWLTTRTGPSNFRGRPTV